VNRTFDWPEKLDEVIRKAKTIPFSWGKHDCTLFACDCVKAMTGEDFAKGFRGKYKSALGAIKLIKRLDGVDDIFSLADKKLGESYPATTARRGDVIGYLDDGNKVLGIAVAGKSVLLTPDGKITFKTLSECDRCWRI